MTPAPSAEAGVAPSLSGSIWDVATLHAWRAWLPCNDVHARIFDDALRPEVERYDERIRLYGTHIALGALRWERSVQGDPAVSEALVAGLDLLLG